MRNQNQKKRIRYNYGRGKIARVRLPSPVLVILIGASMFLTSELRLNIRTLWLVVMRPSQLVAYPSPTEHVTSFLCFPLCKRKLFPLHPLFHTQIFSFQLLDYNKLLTLNYIKFSSCVKNRFNFLKWPSINFLFCANKFFIIRN